MRPDYDEALRHASLSDAGVVIRVLIGILGLAVGAVVGLIVAVMIGLIPFNC